MTATLRVGTRGSPLALAQTDEVVGRQAGLHEANRGRPPRGPHRLRGPQLEGLAD